MVNGLIGVLKIPLWIIIRLTSSKSLTGSVTEPLPPTANTVVRKIGELELPSVLPGDGSISLRTMPGVSLSSSSSEATSLVLTILIMTLRSSNDVVGQLTLGLRIPQTKQRLETCERIRPEVGTRQRIR